MKMKKGVIFGMVGVLIGTAGAYATLNIDTTINNLYSYVKYLFVTSDGTANGTTTIKLDGTNGRIDAKSVYADNLYKGGNAVATEDYVNTKASQTLSSAKSYTDSKVSQTLSSAKSYTDSKVTQTLSSAKNYTYSIANQTLSSAKSYANTNASQILRSAKSYTDSKASQTLSSANLYTNRHVVDNALIKNGAITFTKLSTSLKSKLSSSTTTRNRLVNVCNASNIGMPSRNGAICAEIQVTHDRHCVSEHRDGAKRGGRGSENKCWGGRIWFSNYQRGNNVRVRQTRVGRRNLYVFR